VATKVVMAQLSPTMEEGKLLDWKVSEGDRVEQGDVVAEIETDKANMDVESLGAGVLRKIVVEVGQSAPVGTLIGIVADDDEDIEDLLALADEVRASLESGSAAPSAPAPAAAHTGAEAQAVTGTPDPGAPSAAAPSVVPGMAGIGRPTPAAPVRADGERVKASPVARRLAAEAGIDVATIAGTGPGGRVVRADIEDVLESVGRGRRTRPGADVPPRVGFEARVEEASTMRKVIARRLTESVGPVPHFFLRREIDMEELFDFRARLNSRPGAAKIGVNAVLLKAAAEALARHPTVNSSWDEAGAVRYHGSADIGIAVSIDGGLLTPVLRGADSLGIDQVAAQSADLISRARVKKLTPEEYLGATLTVSNLGMFGIDEFSAIINPPEGAILAIGRTAQIPVAHQGGIHVRRRMKITMSCDHRVIDGAEGARFLATLAAILENPGDFIS